MVLSIKSLQGIKYFTALQYLYCSGNQLTTLDISGCTSLQWLDCRNNQLTTLDISGCTSLQWLDCRNNQLTTLDISGCTSLQWLDCRNNQLTTLDLRNTKIVQRYISWGGCCAMMMWRFCLHHKKLPLNLKILCLIIHTIKTMQMPPT